MINLWLYDTVLQQQFTITERILAAQGAMDPSFSVQKRGVSHRRLLGNIWGSTFVNEK